MAGFLSRSCLVSSPWWPFLWACGVVVVGGEEYVVLSHRQLFPGRVGGDQARRGVLVLPSPGRRFQFIPIFQRTWGANGLELLSFAWQGEIWANNRLTR